MTRITQKNTNWIDLAQSLFSLILNPFKCWCSCVWICLSFIDFCYELMKYFSLWRSNNEICRHRARKNSLNDLAWCSAQACLSFGLFYCFFYILVSAMGGKLWKLIWAGTCPVFITFQSVITQLKSVTIKSSYYQQLLLIFSSFSFYIC